MSDKKENKNRRIAWTVSIGLHVLLLLAFIFMIAWREPNPPYPEYGIEVNFGLDEVGSGEVQPTTPVNDSEETEEAQPEEQAVEEVIEEIEPIPEEVSAELAETSTTDAQAVIKQPNESPDVIDEKKEVVETPKPVEEEKEEIEEEPEPVKPPIVYKKKDGADGNDGEANTSQEANQGDNVDQTGDKGQEDGKEGIKYEGAVGGGNGGPSVSINGWTSDERMYKKDSSDENGKITFKFTIDDNGDVISVIPIEITVSPSVVNYYKQQFLLTTFSQIDPSETPLLRTSGTATFIIKSK